MLRFFSLDNQFVGSLAADANAERAWEFRLCVDQARRVDNRVLAYERSLSESVRTNALTCTNNRARCILEELKKLMENKSRSRVLSDSECLCQFSDLRFVENPPQPTQVDLEQFDELTTLHFQAKWQATPDARADLLRRFLLGSKSVTLIDRYIVPAPGDQHQRYDQRVQAVNTILEHWCGSEGVRKLCIAVPCSSRGAFPPRQCWSVLEHRCRQGHAARGVTVECKVLLKPPYNCAIDNHNRYLISELGVLSLQRGHEELCLEDPASQATYDRDLNRAYRWIFSAVPARRLTFDL